VTAGLRHAGPPDDMAQLGILLPSQHLGSRRKQIPEQRLMIAVLHDAIECLEKYRFAATAEGRQLFREAQRWFLADEADWPYSFEGICGVLDLDSNTVRQRLRVAPEQGNESLHHVR
jgi:hypothetical protein